MGVEFHLRIFGITWEEIVQRDALVECVDFAVDFEGDVGVVEDYAFL